MIDLSIVVPVYNEECGINPLLDRLLPTLEKCTNKYEIIFVNDGSTDKTAQNISNQIMNNKKIRLINLVRNYGHMEALSTGLSLSKGRFVLSLDGDLQHPPELIEEMYKMAVANKEIEVVQAVRTDRDADSFFKRISASLFYRISRRITGVQVIKHAADFRIMNRNAVDLINSLPESKKILRFLIPELGLKIETISFVCEERTIGKSKYSLSKMMKFAFDSVISFSTKPLRMMSIFGFALSGIFMIGTVVTFTIWLIAKTVPGWTSIFMLLLTSNALILGSLGLLGEYVSKVRESTLGRPNSRWYEVEA